MVWNAQLLADYEDGPAILAIGQDITSLKQAQEKALQSERLAAIGQMIRAWPTKAATPSRAVKHAWRCWRLKAKIDRNRSI
jgi:hypothetical protein